MAVVLDKANVVLVDKDGNRATVTSLTDNDLNKLSVGLSDVSDLKTRVKAVEDNGYVSYNSVQTLDESQRSQAQTNMDAPGLSANNTFTGNMTVEANVKADSMTLNTRSDYAKLSASTNDHGIKLLGGSSATTGASIDLRGSTDTDAPNTFTVSAANGVALAGSKDGSLTWNSENVVRKVNNLPADASGNVLLGTEKSTFNKVVYDTGYFSITTNKAYSFDLTGSDLANVSKENVNIRLIAKVTTAHGGYKVGDIAQLTPSIDTAPVDWEVIDVCSYISGNTLYIYSGSSDGFSIHNGTDYLRKPNVQIKAVLTAFIPDDGSILLIAEDQTNTSKLIGLTDGTLTWKDKNIVRSVNNVTADANGNVTISSLIPNQIIQSPVPLTDANLHLLDGALLSGNGAYADYVTMMAELYNADSTATCWTTESAWQTSVSTYGECGKFVYDSVNNTLRLPKLTSFVQATSSASELGSLVEAGLPNIDGSAQWMYMGYSEGSGIYKGAFRYDPNTSPLPGETAAPNASSAGYPITFDASKSNSIYGNSTTVQPQAIKYYFYIVIGTISKADIQVNIDNVMSDLTLKADKDFSNVTAPVQAFKDMSVSWGMPDYTAEVSLGEPSTYQTLPCDCFVTYSSSSGGGAASNGFYYANEDESLIKGFRQALTYDRKGLGLFIPKGWKVKAFASGSKIYYYPLKGVN